MRLVARALFVAALAGLGLGLATGAARLSAVLAGAALGIFTLVFDAWLQRCSPAQVAGGTLGLVAGLVCALLSGSLLLGHAPEHAQPAAAAMVLLVFAWLGSSVGSVHGTRLPMGAGAPAAKVAATPKIIDTSVIIDGRIVDVIAAGFLEGPVLIPQFILRELQQVADSSDALKRNRGRKGLDVLKAIQASDRITTEVTTEDTSEVREVDGKLMWLAEQRGAQILTNDYNLNKIAQLRRIRVLNVNDLANAMKPVVLPGEMLSVQIIKEGKERNQGVGYLDDGTMVVVENGRRLISSKVDVVVTSVIQTNAGKMIFGSLEDEVEQRPPARVVRRTAEHDGPYAGANGGATSAPTTVVGQG